MNRIEFMSGVIDELNNTLTVIARLYPHDPIIQGLQNALSGKTLKLEDVHNAFKQYPLSSKHIDHIAPQYIRPLLPYIIEQDHLRETLLHIIAPSPARQFFSFLPFVSPLSTAQQQIKTDILTIAPNFFTSLQPKTQHQPTEQQYSNIHSSTAFIISASNRKITAHQVPSISTTFIKKILSEGEKNPQQFPQLQELQKYYDANASANQLDLELVQHILFHETRYDPDISGILPKDKKLDPALINRKIELFGEWLQQLAAINEQDHPAVTALVGKKYTEPSPTTAPINSPNEQPHA